MYFARRVNSCLRAPVHPAEVMAPDPLTEVDRHHLPAAGRRVRLLWPTVMVFSRGAVLAAAVVVMGGGGVWPATGSGHTPTCTFSADIVLEPGLSRAPSSGTFATESGRPGSYRCQAFGSERTGEAGTEGRYGTADADSCTEGGEGTGRLRLGDDAGGGYTFTYTAFDDGVATGRFRGDRFEGTFRLTARNGNCAAARVTRVHMEGEGTVTP